MALDRRHGSRMCTDSGRLHVELGPEDRKLPLINQPNLGRWLQVAPARLLAASRWLPLYHTPHQVKSATLLGNLPYGTHPAHTHTHTVTHTERREKERERERTNEKRKNRDRRELAPTFPRSTGSSATAVKIVVASRPQVPSANSAVPVEPNNWVLCCLGSSSFRQVEAVVVSFTCLFECNCCV